MGPQFGSSRAARAERAVQRPVWWPAIWNSRNSGASRRVVRKRLLRMRCARFVRGYKIPPFIRIDGFEIQSHVGAVAIAGVANALAEVVHLAGFGGKARER